MHEFEPRLLLPGTPGIPSHMRVSDDARIYDELRDPSVTAVVYVPQWSQPVSAAFARISALHPALQHSFEESINPAVFAIGDVEDFALGNIIRWLRPAFRPHAKHENIHVVHEVAAAHAQFACAALRVLDHHPGRRPSYHPLSRHLTVLDDADTRLQPHHPQISRAHTDPGDTGLFSVPLGSVLVDQDNLDVMALRQEDRCSASSGRLVHRIALVHLANRLWQIPDGAFALWRGEPRAHAQYHFFPHVDQEMQRFRAFAHP